MRPVVLGVALLLVASACSVCVTSANVNYDDPTGGVADDVVVHPITDAEYFDVRSDGVVTLQPGYREAIAITCDIGWGRSCLIGTPRQPSSCTLNPFASRASFCSRLVGVAKGSACYCNGGGIALSGHAV